MERHVACTQHIAGSYDMLVIAMWQQSIIRRELDSISSCDSTKAQIVQIKTHVILCVEPLSTSSQIPEQKRRLASLVAEHLADG